MKQGLPQYVIGIDASGVSTSLHTRHFKRDDENGKNRKCKIKRQTQIPVADLWEGQGRALPGSESRAVGPFGPFRLSITVI